MILKNKAINQQGQTLIFVILIMTIALAIGVSISNRTVSSIKRTTNVDSSSRTLAAAEAGAEYMLSQTPTQIASLLSGVPVTNCATVVEVPYPSTGSISSGATNDISKTSAIVQLKRFGCLTNGASYKFDVEQDDILELKFDQTNLSSNAISFDISWTYPSSISSGLYITEIHGNSDNNVRTLRSGYQDILPSPSNNFTPTPGRLINYNTQTFPRVVRILSLYSPSTITITNKTAGYTFPFQGYQITSTGVLGDSPIAGAGSKDLVRRSVTVYRSLPYLPSLFNFALYSQTGAISK